MSRRDPTPHYRAAEFFLLRAPALPVGRLTAILNGCPLPSEDDARPHDWEGVYTQDIQAAWKLPIISAAIRAASPDLADAGDRLDDLSANDRRRAVMSLGRYLNRMAVRSTPFGLMAGVAGGAFGESARTTLSGQSIGVPRARPDMGWLMHLVKQEADEARTDFLVRSNDLLHESRGRLWLPTADGYGAHDDRVVTIRMTRAVRSVLDHVRLPRTLGALRAQLAREFPGTAPAQVEGMVDQLLELGILIGAWRPRLLTESPDSAPAVSLAATAGAPAAQVLEPVNETIRSFNLARDPYRVAELDERVRAATPGYDKPVVQIDARLSFQDGDLVLPREVQPLAEEAVRVLVDVAAATGYPSSLRDYANAFNEHYGAMAEVPLLELLSAETGLGPPAGYRNPPRTYPLAQQSGDQDRPSARDSVLARMVSTALAEGDRSVELDDRRLAELAAARKPDVAHTPPPMPVVDVQMQLIPPCDAHPSWRGVLCGGGIAPGGNTFARFHDLLTPAVRSGLRELARTESARVFPALPVELSYLPLDGRLANVAIRPPVLTWEMPVNVAPSVPADRVIPLADVVVGVRDGRLRLRSASRGRDLYVTQHTMLNPILAPNVCRFLLQVSRAYFRAPAFFDWGAFGQTMPFLPRVTRGDLVLRRARWKLLRADLPAGGRQRRESLPAFAQAVREWRELWRAPRHVYLSEGDNAILLDLESAPSMEELRLAISRTQADTVLLEEALPAPGDGFLRDAAGERYAAEVVVPVVIDPGQADEPAQPSEPRPATAPRPLPPPRARFRTVGDDWLFVKLYAEREAQDDLVVREMPGIVGDLAQRYGVGAPFFIRYADPAPHIRLRFPAHDERARDGSLSDVAAWARGLAADGLLVDFCFATYAQEIERYGGPALIGAAESLFRHDSSAAILLLRRLLDGDSALDRVSLVTLALERLSQFLLPSLTERRSLARYAAHAKAGGAEYRAAAPALWDALTGAGADHPTLEAAAGSWREPARFLGGRLAELSAADELWPDRQQILLSVLHMHCNRMGLQRSEEAIAYGMWRRLLDRVANSSGRAATRGGQR
jgi:thiopeptide-type bacteriocin biosynthesis protein